MLESVLPKNDDSPKSPTNSGSEPAGGCASSPPDTEAVYSPSAPPLTRNQQNANFAKLIKAARDCVNNESTELLKIRWQAGKEAARFLGFTRDSTTGALVEDHQECLDRYGWHDSTEVAKDLGMEHKYLINVVHYFKLCPESLMVRICKASDSNGEPLFEWTTLRKLLNNPDIDDTKRLELIERVFSERLPLSWIWPRFLKEKREAPNN